MTNLFKRLPILQLKIEELCQLLDARAARGEAVDVGPLTLALSLDFLLAAMFGVDGRGLQGGEGSLGGRILSLVDECLRDHTYSKFFPLRGWHVWSPRAMRARRAGKELMRVAKELMGEYRRVHAETLDTDTSILAHILRGPYPSEEDRAADVVILLIGGHDTTGYTIAWTLIELARSPGALARLQDELDRANPSRGPWTNDQLCGLTFFHVVLKESMRLWPAAAPGPTREMHADLVLDDGTLIPAGADVTMPLLSLHRTGISDPDAFLPERWEDEGGSDAARLAQAYLPFSAGLRNCVGQNLAIQELRLVLATLVQRYDVKLVSSVQSEHYLTLKPVRVFLEFHRRKA